MITENEIRHLAATSPLPALMLQASQMRDLGHGKNISYSKKVFIPLTQLCQNFCHYCTFAQPPARLEAAYLSPEQVLEIARAGQEAGCHEALFTLGDKPELRYPLALEELRKKGHPTTLSYLAEMCALVLKETTLLPHVNPGIMSSQDISMLRKVSISQGIMLENLSPRLLEKGQVHYRSPDKDPIKRLETIRLAGELKVPFTSGILIGIGETREERISSLLALRELHQQYGHIQEIIIQNFRAKPLTKMANSPEPDLDDLLWSIAVARLIFGPEMNIQAPPNLSPETYPSLIHAGLNDWGGISPVTKDFVNPEAPWPHIKTLKLQTESLGKNLVQRLASYPTYCLKAHEWHDSKLAPRVLAEIDGEGFVREENWFVGTSSPAPKLLSSNKSDSSITKLIDKAFNKIAFSEEDIVKLFQARENDFRLVCEGADALRKAACGDNVTYVVNRNINYTNVCYFKCQFCAFSKGKLSENLRGKPYDLDLSEVARRAIEAWERGATEVCMQGGIHPQYTGNTYFDLCRTVKSVVPEMHIHAFSPLEVWTGARTLGLSLTDYLKEIRNYGLGTLPGTAAEILDDEIRALICPDKINTQQWLEVMECAHEAGIRTTSTIMFGHTDSPRHWARHLIRLRELQQKTGGFTEFVPLPFVHMETPMFLKGKSRRGPTWRETVLMHAVSRLVLYPYITNIQASWVKLGEEGAKACLNAGVNDLGGTLMNESISRAAGTIHGQEMSPQKMESIILSIGRIPKQRTTLYGEVSMEQQKRSHICQELSPIILTPLKKRSVEPVCCQT